MKRYNPNKYITEKVDVNEIIGFLKAKYGTKIKDMMKDTKFKQLSSSDKEYVITELKADGL